MHAHRRLAAPAARGPTLSPRAPTRSPDRDRALDRAADEGVDVLIIGGGISGAGVALDAVTRGYRVALVEREDIGSGTSSRSSKLVHGGIRYLETGDLAMVAEGVRERDRLRRLAPHLVRPLPFAIPTPSQRRRWELKAGMLLYDALAFGRNLRRHTRLDLGAFLRHAPGVVRPLDGGAYRYFDSQTDDARLTLAVALTAIRYGALVANHTEVVGLLENHGRVVGAEVHDRLRDQRATIRSRWVVSASGVWADSIRRLAPQAPTPQLAPSRGVHLTFPRSLLPINGAVTFPSSLQDGRMNFAIPWGQQVYVGTTDEIHAGDRSRPAVEPADARYLAASVSHAFGLEIGARDAIGAWAGLRPLMTGAGGVAPKDLSRRHALVEDPDGLVTVTGGKLTTYRQMAEDVVDLVTRRDGNRARCVTHRLPLGMRGSAEQGQGRVRALARHLGYGPEVADPLFHRHGDRAAEVLERCRQDGEDEPLVKGLPYLVGEVRWAVTEELARSLDDVLDRRLRVAIRHRGAGGSGVLAAARIVAEELGWDESRTAKEVDGYLRGVARQRGPVPLDTSWLHR